MTTYTITAGHSNTDPGAVRGQYKEAALMQQLATIVVGKLVQRGHKVRTDVIGGVNHPLRYAINLIAGSAVSVELHTNAGPESARGVEVYSLPKHKARSQAIASRIATVLGTPLRGDKGWRSQADSQHGRLGFVGAGGHIVEVFFLSNPKDLEAYLAKYWLVAQAIVEGLEA